jgi:hypothetical protein
MMMLVMMIRIIRNLGTMSSCRDMTRAGPGTAFRVLVLKDLSNKCIN